MGSIALGSGMALGEHQVTNDALSRVCDTSDDWIRERTGISTRYYVADGTSTSDLGVRAAKQAIEDGGPHARRHRLRRLRDDDARLLLPRRRRAAAGEARARQGADARHPAAVHRLHLRAAGGRRAVAHEGGQAAPSRRRRGALGLHAVARSRRRVRHLRARARPPTSTRSTRAIAIARCSSATAPARSCSSGATTIAGSSRGAALRRAIRGEAVRAVGLRVPPVHHRGR